MDTNQEKKDENRIVDVNQNTGDNSIIERQSKEKKNDGQSGSEETVDINLEEKNENSPVDEKQSKTMRTIVIVVLLLLPIAYIFYKTTGSSNSSPEQATDQSQKIDIAAYESVANATPSFSNLLNLSNAYINSGMAGKAIEPLNKAIELNPKSAVAYSNLGFAYTCIQNYSKGIEYGEIAVKLDSTFLLAKNNLNWAKSEQKKILDIIDKLDKTPEKERNTFYYLGLGLNYLRLQNYDKSIEASNKILITEPKNSAALINIGVAYMSKQQYDNAIKYFQKAVDANSNDQLAKNNLAWALSEKIKEDDLAQKNKAEASQKK